MRKLSALVIMLALVIGLQPLAFAEEQAQAVASSDPSAKIRSGLLSDMRGSGAKSLAFMARVQPGTDLSPYAQQWFARPFVDPMGLTVAIGTATPAGIMKMATLPEVVMVQRPESLIEAPTLSSGDPDVALNGVAAPKLAAQPAVAGGPAPEGWYHTGTAIHARRLPGSGATPAPVCAIW
ncbi:MAG: hypothetical protein HC822_04520 [Oscillochloris sp.]|nr:hypothetical protein [Oscillochloris sp.]